MGRSRAKAHPKTVMGKEKIIPLLGTEFKRDRAKDGPSVAFI
jgi:hypothetical protein